MAGNIAAQLRAAGMSDAGAASKAAMLERVLRAFAAWKPEQAGGRRAFFVPGRVELLGKHTDYARGRSLLCAIERGFCVLAAPRGDGIVGLLDVDWKARTEFPIGGPAPKARRGRCIQRRWPLAWRRIFRMPAKAPT